MLFSLLEGGERNIVCSVVKSVRLYIYIVFGEITLVIYVIYIFIYRSIYYLADFNESELSSMTINKVH